VGFGLEAARGKYAALIAPSFANASLNAGLSTIYGRGTEFAVSSFDVGDMFIQPIWLDWEFKHFDVTLAYGFYAPVGKYHIQTRPHPVVLKLGWNRQAILATVSGHISFKVRWHGIRLNTKVLRNRRAEL